MQIIKSTFFTTIIPDKGYKIVNKNNGKFYKKVLLGPNDSVDNYGEVVDEKYIDMDYVIELDKLKSTIEENELTIDLLLYSIDEIYTSVEPLLDMVPMTIETENKVSKLVNFYVLMIKRDLKTIEEIPERFREEVSKLI
jgi:hypothetical protein